jgi:hypothetical protein
VVRGFQAAGIRQEHGPLFLVHYVLLGVEHQPAVLGGEVFELGIGLGDQGEFFRAGPALYFFLSGDGRADIDEVLVEEKAVASVLAREG